MNKIISRWIVFMLVIVLGLFLVSCKEKEMFVVTFDSKGWTVIEPVHVEKGNIIEMPLIERQGYTLEGWYTSLDDGQTLLEKWLFNADLITNDLTLYAKWEINQYSISFESNGGSSLETITQDYNTVVSVDDPNRGGYQFLGWFSDEELTNPYEIDKIAASNIILYAKWQITNITFGGSLSDNFSSIIEDHEGNFVAVGSTSSDDYDIADGYHGGFSDGLIVKFNSSGTILWSKTVGGSYSDRLLSIIEDRDGNYVAVGSTSSDDYDITDGNNGAEDTLIVKFDSSGDILWNKTIGGSLFDEFNSVIEDCDGNYVVAGITASDDADITDGNNGGSFDALIVKLDSSGNTIWSRTIGGSLQDQLSSIIEGSDGKYVAVGSTTSNDYDITDGNNGESDTLIVKLDSSGNILWNKTIGGSFWDELSSVIEDSNGNYIAVGTTSSDDVDITDGNNGILDALIIKLDSNGNLLWNKTIGGSNMDEFSSIIEDSDGNYVAVGYTSSDDVDIIDGKTGGFSDALIVKLASNGTTLWSKTIGGSDMDEFLSIIQDNNGNYVIVGQTVSDDFDITDGNYSGDTNDALVVWLYNND